MSTYTGVSNFQKSSLVFLAHAVFCKHFSVLYHVQPGLTLIMSTKMPHSTKIPRLSISQLKR